ncbi:hypothetical protein ACFVJ5_08410 [Nocardia sp. NPDC127606]|uniref:YunG family protein n=1 Tax=Nocardia sp. NPDC127606 TaxID=3345406 RepID=UPI00363F265B
MTTASANRLAGGDGQQRERCGYHVLMGSDPLETLRRVLQSAWSAETSASADWTDDNAAKGQCAVTACVVQDYLGGDILHTTASMPGGKTVSHYINLIDGIQVDLTAEQFPEYTQFSPPTPKTKSFASTRDYCLSYVHTKQRYDLLRTRVAERLDAVGHRVVHSSTN